MGILTGQGMLVSGIFGGILAASTIGPLAYGVGYFRASFQTAGKLEACQDKLNGHILADGERVDASSKNLATQIEEFTKIQKELKTGVDRSAQRERDTANKLKGFKDAIEKMEIPSCVADGAGRELRKLTD